MTTTSMIPIRVNGADDAVPAGSSVAELLSRLEIGGPGTAVAVNDGVVRAAEFATTILSSGDRVEIIRAVGGG